MLPIVVVTEKNPSSSVRKADQRNHNTIAVGRHTTPPSFPHTVIYPSAELCRGAEKHTRGMEKRARRGQGMEKPHKGGG